MLSTRDLSLLPDIESLNRRMQQLAALEAAFALDFGTHAFYPKWTKTTQVGAVKDGGGDELFAHFTPAGCFLKGFAHESEMSPYKAKPHSLWPGLLAGVPTAFQSSLDVPAFDIPNTTFAIWRLTTDTTWHTDKIEYSNHYYGDGSADLLPPLIVTADEFAEWLQENFELDDPVDAEIVAEVFRHSPLTDDQLRVLNPTAALRDVRKAVEETGYPLAERKLR